MSFFNVHFQRAPIAGTVYDQKYIEGKFLDIRFSKKILEFEGERNVTYIKAANGNFFAVVMQIASNSVRRIVSYVKPNDNITRGQKIGLIRFGSQVDLIIPAKNVKLLVREKSSVKAGLTIIGELQNE
jgi:phosphatidylserine decarboxylase